MRYLDKDICSTSVYTTRCTTRESHPCTDVHVERSGIVCTKYMPVECRYIDIHTYILASYTRKEKMPHRWIRVSLAVILLTLNCHGMCRRDLHMVEHDRNKCTSIECRETRSDDSFTWKPCGESKNGSSVFEVSKVTLEPERIRRGTTATFRIAAQNDEWKEMDVDSGVVDMVVHLGGVEVFSEQDLLCDVTSCPIPGGGVDFGITYTRSFPFYTPPGRYHLMMQGHVPTAKSVLFCVEIAFTVHFL